MTKLPTIYDLLLALSAELDDEARSQIVSAAASTIEQGGGRVELSQDWGRRPLAYEIAHQAEGHYHLLQFAGPPAVLDALTHALRIQTGVLRFRVIKVEPGQPPAPSTPPPVVAGAAVGAYGQSGEDAPPQAIDG
jgi:small subunit ribosomal protein S6